MGDSCPFSRVRWGRGSPMSLICVSYSFEKQRWYQILPKKSKGQMQAGWQLMDKIKARGCAGISLRSPGLRV